MHFALNAAFAEADLQQQHAAAAAAGEDGAGGDALAAESQLLAATLQSGPAPSGAAPAQTAAQSLRDEAPLARCLRVAYECEFAGAYARAARTHQTRVALAEEAAAAGRTGGLYDASVWYDYGAYLLRRGALLKGVVCLREAVAVDPAFVPALLALAAAQCARAQAVEAGVMAGAAVSALQQHIAAAAAAEADTAADYGNLLPLAHGLVCLIAEACGRSDDAAEALAAALEALRAVFVTRGVEAEEAATAATPGALYILLARYLLRLRVLPLARLALSQVRGVWAGTPFRSP